MSRTKTHFFDEVKLFGLAKPVCKVCRKIRTRKIKAYQTINPFNKNKDGHIKTGDEIQIENSEELRKKIIEIETQGVICKACEEK